MHLLLATKKGFHRLTWNQQQHWLSSQKFLQICFDLFLAVKERCSNNMQCPM